MKHLLNSTAILSMVLMPMAPLPSMAQVLDEEGRILAADGTVLCEPTAEAACDVLNEDIIKAALAIQERVDAEAAAQAEADAAKAPADAAAQAEAEAAKAAADAAAQAEAEAAKAAADAAAQAEAEAAKAAADAAAQAEADAAKAAADAAAQAEADAAKAAADAAAQAEGEAAKAAADAAAQAEADAAKAAADAAAQAEAEAAKEAADAAAQAEAEAAKAAADAAAQAEADAAKAAAGAAAQAEADAAKAAEDAAAQVEAEAAKAAEDAAAQAEAEAAKAAADAAAQAEVDAAAQAEIDAAAQAEAAAVKAAADAGQVDAAAGLAVAETPIDPDAPLVDAPVISTEEVEALSDLLAAPASADTPTAAPEVTAPVEAPPPVVAADATSPVDPAAAEAALLAIPAADNSVATTVETISPEAVRTSAQEFSAPPQVVDGGKKTGLSDLEKVGLFVLGAVVIGQVIKSAQAQNDAGQDAGQTVVSNTGDRVVVQNPDGSYGLYKDDDAILRQPGSTVRTETYNDGSSRTIVQRSDGTQVVTVRDATGRVLRRAQYDRLGRELVLLDDFAAEVPVNVADLPAPRSSLSTRSNDAALRAALAARQIETLERSFSLRQIRDIAQVRALAAEVDVEKVTFASGSSAITPQQANALADLGAVMQDLLDANPAEMFLIEGHTDATGGAAMNLALSDRRAESVALALSEYFAIPPENMVVQGYGETELRIPTQGPEELNRRVGVRIITPLLTRAQ